MFDRVLKTSLLFISTSKYTFEPWGTQCTNQRSEQEDRLFQNFS